ncbi:hypothetical protein TSAR_009207 [Trichomalopsis sarcophagae]|uniref:Uncharacterized protein n=1 Tax=Trichomalopsis sarcophagae TaxID=543379 RepID=A0A232ER21_9HYME|nr:hypothetical protein TSAR_009207 [Trichomalopsis sarcophagae]
MNDKVFLLLPLQRFRLALAY